MLSGLHTGSLERERDQDINTFKWLINSQLFNAEPGPFLAIHNQRGSCAFNYPLPNFACHNTKPGHFACYSKVNVGKRKLHILF